jgi:hypothetical protein
MYQLCKRPLGPVRKWDLSLDPLTLQLRPRVRVLRQKYLVGEVVAYGVATASEFLCSLSLPTPNVRWAASHSGARDYIREMEIMVFQLQTG